MVHLIVSICHHINEMSFSIHTTMNNSNAQNRPKKRRRMNVRLTEDDIETADAIIINRVYHQSVDGPAVEQVNQIPVWNNRPGPSIPPLPTPQNVNDPQVDIPHDISELLDFDEHDHPETGARVCETDA